MAFIGDHVPYERRQATLARFIAGQIMGLIGGQVIGRIVGGPGTTPLFLAVAPLLLLVGLAFAHRLAHRPVP